MDKLSGSTSRRTQQQGRWRPSWLQFLTVSARSWANRFHRHIIQAGYVRVYISEDSHRQQGIHS